MTITTHTTGNVSGLMATPALDLTPTGHLPHLVEQARPHPDDHSPLLDLDKVIAALPEALPTAMKTALPGEYTPELAAEIIDDITKQLTALRQTRTSHLDGILTKAQRTPVYDTGLGAWRTTPVETKLRDLDDQHTPAENTATPFLAAEMIVTDYRPQAYGRQTEVWLSYGITTGTLTPVQAREALEAMRGFCNQLAAVVELAEESAAADFDGDPEIARLDREAEDRRFKAITEARA
jgi:hypothetical protein